jgi:hypothetical protein
MDMKAILKAFDNSATKPVSGTSDMKRYISMLSESPVVANSNDNPVDTVTLDIPLLIRLLEYAKEDAKTDMDLHRVSEKLIQLSKEGNMLSMDQYDEIVHVQQPVTHESIIDYINKLKS